MSHCQLTKEGNDGLQKLLKPHLPNTNIIHCMNQIGLMAYYNVRELTVIEEDPVANKGYIIEASLSDAGIGVTIIQAWDKAQIREDWFPIEAVRT